jgi:autonomous glycyl radical cofactor GrcA
LQNQKKDSDECSDFALLLRAEKAEARVVALEQELEESAIEFAQKVSELESEIRKLQKPYI